MRAQIRKAKATEQAIRQSMSSGRIFDDDLNIADELLK
jgi:hypothetical protein